MGIYLSLGSNMGERLHYLTQGLIALKALDSVTLKGWSSVYETKPWGKIDQPDFFNLVVEISTALPPIQLLRFCQKIERDLNRTRDELWGPRTIDIDILLYHDIPMEKPDLKLPHPYLKQREFVLTPLMEIAPSLNISGEIIEDLVAKVEKTQGKSMKIGQIKI